MPVQSYEASRDILGKAYVVGPDSVAKCDMNKFLLDECHLKPISKEIAVAWTSGGAPFSERILDTIFEHAQIVIFLLTGEDKICLYKGFKQNNDENADQEFWQQPTQDRIFEAGFAFGRYHERVFLVRSGEVRLLSDVAGRYVYDFEDPEHRNALKNILLQIATRALSSGKKERRTSTLLRASGVEALVIEAERRRRKKVFVVFGRNKFILGEVRAFLRVIGLWPITWGQALNSSGKVAGPTGEVLDAAFSQACAVVVLLTGDDEALPELAGSGVSNLDHKGLRIAQPRANVLFEAGMAFGDRRLSDHTILIDFEFDKLRLGSHLADHQRLRLNNSTDRREEFIQRLHTAGCLIDLKNPRWHNTGNFYFTYHA